LACVVSVLGASGAATASAATMPPQGIFESCALETQLQTCIQRLQVMHAGGVQIVVIPAWGVSLPSLSAYASAANGLGMSVMWQIAGPGPFWWQGGSTGTGMAPFFPGFASACGCQQNGPLLAYTIQWLSQLPGTYGYYAADAYDDTLGSGDQGAMASYVSQIKQQDPTHTVMIGSAGESQTSQFQQIPDVIGTEMYPVTTSSLMPVGANQDMWDSVAQWASDAQQSADAAGKQSAFILQAFTWGDSLADGEAIGACSPSDTPDSCAAKLRYPSSSEQLQLRNEVLANAHPKLIIWFSFYGTYGSSSGSPPSADAAARWSGLSEAIQAPLPTAPAATHAPLITTKKPQAKKTHRPRAHAAGHKRHRRHHRKHRRLRRRVKHPRVKHA
jgi:hypothetical protein